MAFVSLKTLFLLLTTFWDVSKANPVVIKGTSPLGETIVAISSSDPDTEKYLSLSIPPQEQRSLQTIKFNPADLYSQSISLAGRGQAAAGTGRSFVSTSSFNPFLFPLFNLPLNLEGLGLSNIGYTNNFFKSLESIYEPTFGGNGDMKTITAVNDNGHIYGKVNSITFDNRANNRQQVQS